MSTKKSSSGSKSSKQSSSSSSGSSSKSMYFSSGILTNVNVPEEKNNKITILVLIAFIIWQSLILLYLYKLEESDCKCPINWKLDWRHSYIKNFTIFCICVNILKLLISQLRNNKLLMLVLFVLDLIYLYAFFTYIHDLNKNNCNCATEKQYFLNMLLRVFVWFRVIAIICVIILFIIGFFYMSSLGSSKSATK